MSNSTEKAACGDMMPPVNPGLMSHVDIPSSPDLDDREVKMDFYMNAILSKLDTIASKLENNGMVRLAESLDEISNSLGLIKRN